MPDSRYDIPTASLLLEYFLPIRSVLIVRMHHNDDICAVLHRQIIAGFLIVAVTLIFKVGMNDCIG